MSNAEILWAQDRENIFVTLDIMNLQSQDIRLEDRKIIFQGKTENMDYDMVIDLHHEINPDKSEWQIKSTSVKLTLAKVNHQFWNRLTRTKQNNVKKT